MDKKDEIILQQLDVIRSMTERNLRSVNSDFWGTPLSPAEKPGEKAVPKTPDKTPDKAPEKKSGGPEQQTEAPEPLPKEDMKDLQAELEDAIYTYRELFRQDGIQLNYHSDQELYTEPISGDPQRLKQVFCNVLDNAAKHGGAGRRIDASLTREGTVQVVRVRDYGPGVPAAELPYVKQKFYKGSSKARGSGIGLAVCDEIVRLHGGTFDIANAEGGGAVVTISLPMS